METANQKFAKRLRAAMEKAGYEPKPAVLEREFNLRFWGKPMTLHGVRRWLLGESMPKQDKLETLAEWLIVTPQHLRFGEEIGRRIDKRRARWEEAIGYREREAFEAFINLPAPQRKIVKEVIFAFSQLATVHAAEKAATPAKPAVKRRPRA
ncbi:XRE family transcriptional regulator [Herbaspirillum sp. alder98]|uniref:XRE family transcriptional regulator n=1 Tax=Herbaspirillum sp. alder98 TaxID=2913096 RepID=UPI001CD89D15|nr:XRE family transcriptional regulator [Herbaspirillum sp. alder98]MCA1325127.1 XRE family transcriptional regulator [Herbaspirillum sp. alder98]